MKKIDFRAVILAGGNGERFWPISTPGRPKQFLSIFGSDSLIRQTVSRLEGVAEPSGTYVVTSAALADATRAELPELPPENIVGEPERRDTGAAVAVGVAVAARSGDPVVGFFPSDQLVGAPKKFRAVLRKAVTLAAESPSIVTIGITPTYPATGYGYVDPAGGRFVEKPDAAKAASYLKKGYLWNAGMFVARASVFRTAFASLAPDLAPLAARDFDVAAIADAYRPLKRISFDYAVMEKFKGVRVVPGDFGWDDVGGYDAFDRYFPHDSSGNVREGPCTVVDSQDNICVSRSARISLLGVKNLVVVATGDAVLVADKSRVAEMKRLVAGIPAV